MQRSSVPVPIPEHLPIVLASLLSLHSSRYTSKGDPLVPSHCLPVHDFPSRSVTVRSCFLDGMDPMTSNSVQARHSYR